MQQIGIETQTDKQMTGQADRWTDKIQFTVQQDSRRAVSLLYQTKWNTNS